MNGLATTFYQLFADNLAVRPEKKAVVDPERATSYRGLGRAVDRIAADLRRRGIAPGDRVVVHLRKSVVEVAAMLAVAKVGGVVVNVSRQWTPAQLAFVADDCGAHLLLVEPQMAPVLSAGRHAISAERLMPLTSEDREEVDPGGEVPRIETELAMIIYTSGSTGRPKGVMLTHRNIIAGAQSVARFLRLSEDDRLLSVLPYSFDYGLNQLTTMMLMGGTIVHQPVAMPAEIVRTIAEHGVTGVAAVPPLWGQIVRLLDQAPVRFQSLRRITNSGGSIPANILRRLPHVFPGVDIYLMYGLTEAFRSTYLDPDRFGSKMGSIGRAIPGSEVYVVKAGGGLAGPGEQGELVHRGPLVSLGYWNRPELTREKIRPCPDLADRIGDEPVVFSGDIVEVDDDGDLWFLGRNDAMIKTSGFRLSPDEVEDVAYRSGIVADAVAFGVDDEHLGQVVHLAVTPLDGFDHGALMKHCRAEMPHYMVPRSIHPFPAGMPRTASGKLDRPAVVSACQATPGPSLRPEPTA